jgi:hypothetical protein
MEFPLDFELHENPVYTGINYIFRRDNGGLISVFSHPGSDLYEIFDMEHMEDVELMTMEEIQKYLDREPIRQLIKITPERLN